MASIYYCTWIKFGWLKHLSAFPNFSKPCFIVLIYLGTSGGISCSIVIAGHESHLLWLSQPCISVCFVLCKLWTWLFYHSSSFFCIQTNRVGINPKFLYDMRYLQIYPNASFSFLLIKHWLWDLALMMPCSV